MRGVYVCVCIFSFFSSSFLNIMTAGFPLKNDGGASSLAENKPKIKTMVHRGLHLEDFEWAVHQYESIGYVLVAFVIDSDRYHWRAVFLKAEQVPVCKLKVLLEPDSGPAITQGQLKLKGLDELPKKDK